MIVLKEEIVNGKKIEVVIGDITNEKTDAIVNAANRNLSHGGGVAGAIVRKGGDIIQIESNKIIEKRGPLKTGEAVITRAGNLPCKYVIHTVGPVWGEGDEENKLKKAIESSLQVATENLLKSISIPAVSCGIFGFPKKRGTEIIYKTVKDFLKNRETTIELVRLIGVGDEIPNLFREAMEGK
ncbi:MAG TPA: macro domain-containing protein [Caldisericia bacterium]|nr:macro domain-containing protein [Caldisericia bacterium]HRT37534.1 macro domain-containing protein [Caldisericia bacterium]HRU74529.1 macro domain-containing protein [Caldisericia bacterium]